ncbi:MAG TPA: sulfurtransferase-like selenium metabolism protein YedF [Chitinivibrionales bacterium]|nr:sulfurtransferase-like selenium metabolism protein YedF [Chitinivibrionales bacterium]
MKTVDARDMACPKPLILARKALNGLAAGGRVRVMVDNETSVQNIKRYCRDNGVGASVSKQGRLFALTLAKRGTKAAAANEAAYSGSGAPAKPHVVVFRSDTMGTGPAELGAVLVKAFVNTIKEVKPLPSHLIFYNSGVNLVVEGSALIGPLSDLEKMGVKILACGTCLDYFNLKDRLKVGDVSNMFTILETITAAGHVVTT